MSIGRLKNEADLERFIGDILRRPSVRRSITGGGRWLAGSGAPAPSLGENGDYYLNTTTKTAYVKQSGTWV